jgi:hypothetical protein
MVALAGVGAATALWSGLSSPGERLETVDLSDRSGGGPSLCPWRDSGKDTRVFFGDGPATHRTQTLILTPFRQEIIRQLGPDTPLRENALQVHRVLRNGQTLGTVLVRRTAGRYGALEVVVGVDATGRVTGVRLQRQRERPEIARVLESSEWLGAFRGKTAASAFAPGADLPAVPAEAQSSARAVADAVRSLLVEYTVAEKARPTTRRPHH